MLMTSLTDICVVPLGVTRPPLHILVTGNDETRPPQLQSTSCSNEDLPRRRKDESDARATLLTGFVVAHDEAAAAARSRPPANDGNRRKPTSEAAGVSADSVKEFFNNGGSGAPSTIEVLATAVDRKLAIERLQRRLSSKTSTISSISSLSSLSSLGSEEEERSDVMYCSSYALDVMAYCRVSLDVIAYCRVNLDVMSYCWVSLDVMAYCRVSLDVVSYFRVSFDVVSYRRVDFDVKLRT